MEDCIKLSILRAENGISPRVAMEPTPREGLALDDVLQEAFNESVQKTIQHTVDCGTICSNIIATVKKKRMDGDAPSHYKISSVLQSPAEGFESRGNFDR